MTNGLFSMFSSLIANTPPYRKGLSSRKFLSLFLILFLAVGNVWGATDFSKLNYSGENAIPSGYTLSGKNAPNIADITSPVSSKSINISNGGASDYSAGNLPTKRFMTFVIDEGCSVVIKFTSSSAGRTLNLVPASTKTAVASVSVSSKNAEHTLSYEFSGITSATTYYLCGTSSSNLYIYSIQFTPTSACTEAAPTSVAVSGGATYDKGDALSNMSAAVTGGTGTMSYQWYCNTTNAATVDKEHKIDDATSATLAPYNKVGTRYYYCVVSNCAGSVTSGTTAVTINANCSATGDIFTMTMNSSNAPSSEVKTPASSTMSIDTYINIDGGDIVLVTGSSQHSSITTSPKIKLGGSSGYAKITLDCPLQEGDKITFIKTNKIALAADASGTNKIQLASGTNEYTVTKEDCLFNQSNLFVLRDGSNVEISAITITRPVYRTITLEYADGVTADGSLSVLDGAPAIQPTDPTWEHHRFDGWYNGETPYDWTANVTGDLTLTAHWTQLYTITYAAGNGTATGDAPTQVDKAEGETFTVAANTFEVAGKDFVKWNDGTNDYAPGATYTVGTDNIVLTAQWKAQADKYTVKFMDGETVLDTKVVEVGSHPADIEHPTKPLYTFAAWQLSGSDVNLDEVSGTKDDIVILTARWTAAYASNVNFKEEATQELGVETALNTYHYASDAADISFEEKGLKIKTNAARFYFNVAPGKVAEIKFGYISGATYSVDGGAAETLTSSQLKATYSASAQSCVMTMTTAAYNIVEKVTIHDPFTVSFNANGGDDIAAVQAKPSITLPEPTNGTMNFKGWYDAETGGNLIGVAGASYTPTGNIELHAQWEAQSTINTLSDLKVNGETVLGFTANEHTYRMVLPYKSALPMITSAIPTNANATFALWPKDGPEWTDEYDGGCYRQQVIVTPQDPTAEKGYYDIRITYAPKDGVAIISIAVPNGNGNEQTIAAANITGYIGGTATQKLQSGGTKLGSNGHYIGFTLANSETLKEGDVIRLNVSATNGASHLTLYQNASDANLVKDIEWAATTGVNLIPLPAEAAGLSTLYIYRKTAVCNPNLSEFTILRPTNPILKAITIDGRDGEIDEDNKKVTVELPFSSNVASMIVEPTIAWNAPAATNAIVVNDGSDWVVGDNTYVLTDKDGDQTTYTITLTQAAASADATLKTLTINGNALTLVDGVYEYDYELPYGTTAAPVVVAEANDANATAVVTSVSLTEAVITVTAENGATQEYVINFTVSRAISYVIYDGSVQTDIELPGTGLVNWGLVQASSTEATAITTTCNGKSYTNCVNVFASATASDKRYMTIIIPDGYMAKFYLAGATNSKDKERSLFISKQITGTLDQSIAYSTSKQYEGMGMTSDYQMPGTYYLCSNASIRLYELSVLLYPIDYARDVRQGYYGTICLPNKGQMIGAAVYEIAYMDYKDGAPYKIYFDEILNGKMEAGVPYVFLPNEGYNQLMVTYTAIFNAAADDANGLYGFIGASATDEYQIPSGVGNYIIQNNQYREVLAGADARIVSNRAYIKLSEVPGYNNPLYVAPAPAPGRKRIAMGTTGAQVATGVDQVQGDEVPTKMIINGQLFILRGEKMYDAQGKLVK